MSGKPEFPAVRRIETRIFEVRGKNVLLDFDPAELCGVGTKVLNQAVTRNIGRFPEDFMFRIAPNEIQALNQSQSVTGSQKHRDPSHPPRAFHQEGVAMLSSVLRSRRAVLVNIEIMRSFVRLRRLFATHEDLAGKLADME